MFCSCVATVKAFGNYSVFLSADASFNDILSDLDF